MQLVPRQIVQPSHLYSLEIDRLYITVKNLDNNSKFAHCLNVRLKAMKSSYRLKNTRLKNIISFVFQTVARLCLCSSDRPLYFKAILDTLLKIKSYLYTSKLHYLLKIKLLKFLTPSQNITTRIQNQVLLNQQYISSNYFDDYINGYFQKTSRSVIYQIVNNGIGILIMGKIPLCHHHINLGRNILPKLVPKTCQRIKAVTNRPVGLTPG